MCSTTNLVGICNAAAGQTMFDGYCYSMTSSDVAAYPNITVVLSGPVTLSIPNTQYVYPSGSYYCLGVNQGNFKLLFFFLFLI